MGKVIPSLWVPGVPRASCFFALFPDSPKKWLVLLIYFTGLQPESSVILPHASWPQDPSADHRTDIINRLRAVLFNRASLGSQGTDTEAEGRPRVSQSSCARIVVLLGHLTGPGHRLPTLESTWCGYVLILNFY